jgi:hypothetical protein
MLITEFMALLGHGEIVVSQTKKAVSPSRNVTSHK